MSPTHNFKKTLEELDAFLKLPIQNDRDIAGIIQAFEFTFEQCWKSIQKIATSQAGQVGNPKSAFSYALQNGWISWEEEDLWIQLLKDRNLTPHTYQEDLAHEVLGRIQNQYLRMFQQLLPKLEAQVIKGDIQLCRDLEKRSEST
jgi:nucleotidyltransferase substrate binding protein (TIGR01987 family)